MISRQAFGDFYPLKRLGEVAEFLDGRRRNIAESERKPGPYPYYGANGQQGTIDRYLFDEHLLLLTEDCSSCAWQGRPIAQRISGKSWVNNRVHVLRPSADIDHEFLCRVLETYDVTAFVTGSKRARLTKTQAANIVVPLPPPAEQRKIADVLSRADGLRDKRRLAEMQLDQFLRVLFLEHFGDPASNPRRWPRLPFGSLGENQDRLRSPVPRSPRVTAHLGAYPCYGASGIAAWVDQPVYNGERLLIAEDGANLITRLSPVSRIVHADFAASQHTHVIAANGRAELRFLELAIELTELKPYLSGVVQPRLRRAGLERIPVPVPPLELQREFCRRIEKVETVKSIQRASSERFDELFASLSYRAFRGELQFT